MRVLFIVFIIILMSVAVGGLFLATWHIPAPTQLIEKEISHERLGL